MTRIRPFAALRYDPARVELGRAIAPPYDVIAADERSRLWERDPHNAVRLELTRDVADEADTDYAEVRRTLDAWRQQGVLVRDARPALYGLRQRFTAPDGSAHERDGFFALLRLEDYARRVVRPHERTLAGPRADRLKLMRAVDANLSSVYLLYADRDGELAASLAPERGAAVAEARDESGTLHALTRIDDPERIAAARSFLDPRPVVIADGHHRYETALAYRDECGARGEEEPRAWILAYFANAYAPGNLLLPIHRLIRKGSVPTPAAWRERLSGWRHETLAVPDAAAIPRLLAEHLAPLRDRHAFAADDASGQLQLFSRARSDGDLDVRVIHREVVEGVFGLDEDAVRDGAIDYPKDAARTARELREGRGVVALYLNPLTPDDVFRVTAEGGVLPQKSTFFYPKLPTGLVFRLMEEMA